jgi:hypothetical protein
MNPAQPCIAKQSLVPCRPKYPHASGHVQPHVDDSPRAFHGMIFRCEQFCRPLSSIVNAIGPVGRNRLQLRSDAFQFENHIRNSMLNFRVVRH